jgi:hypothetical protein
MAPVSGQAAGATPPFWRRGMGKFAGYWINDYGDGVPICTAATEAEAMCEAAVRVLSVGTSSGTIGAQEIKVTDDEFQRLTAIVDKYFTPTK